VGSFYPGAKPRQGRLSVAIIRHHADFVNQPLYTPLMPQKPKSQPKPLPFSISETLGSRIARLRKERGLTQAELAEKIGIEKTLVSDYEREKIRMYDDLIIRFAVALNVSSDELLGIKNHKSAAPAISLRLMKRLAQIEKLPEPKKKHIIRTIDDSIKANS
jgi:transcriptional regulator with XRE-family HTH domain